MENSIIFLETFPECEEQRRAQEPAFLDLVTLIKKLKYPRLGSEHIVTDSSKLVSLEEEIVLTRKESNEIKIEYFISNIVFQIVSKINI